MKILNKIKKFFAIILSFIFGFNSEKINEKRHEKDENKDSKNIEQNRCDRNLLKKEDDDGDKQKSSNFYIKEDFRKIYDIINKIEIIEFQLRKVPNENEIIKLKDDLESIKSNLKFLDQKYSKENAIDNSVQEMQKELSNCKSLIETLDKKLEKTKYNNEEKNNKSEKKEVVIDNIKEKNNQNEERIDNIKENNNQNEKIIENIEEKKIDLKENKNSNNKKLLGQNSLKKETEYKEVNDLIKVDVPIKKEQTVNNNLNYDEIELTSQIKNTGIDNIVIKEELNDLISIKQEEISILNKEKQSSTKTDLKTIEKQTNQNKIIKNIYPDKIKNMEVKLETFKKNIKQAKKSNQIKTISLLLNRASKLAMTLKLFSFMKNGNSKLIETNLTINNCIRKSRKIKNKLIKPLKYKQIQKTVSKKLNSNIQVKFIVNDTLIQIKKLKKELYSYNLSDEDLLRLLDQLNEIELNINEIYPDIDKKEKSR